MITLTHPNDPWAIRIFEQYIVPTDIHHNVTKDEAVEYVCRNWNAGGEFWLADRDHGLLIRCVVHNPTAICPHILGNATYLRSAMRKAEAFVSHQGIKLVLVWTQHEVIGRIMQRCGYKLVGHIPKLHYVNGERQDIYGYCKELDQ